MTDQLAIHAQGLVKTFAGVTAVEGLSIDVPVGSIYGFLGPNGSGKTTTIRMLCGLLTPDAGAGKCLGYDILTESRRIKREVGYMPQRFGLYEDLSIVENLEFTARLYGVPRPRRAAAEAIEQLGLTARKKQLAGTLSGGWKQRMALAACVLHAPKLLLLDEPTAGVDPKARREFWDEIHRLAEAGTTVLVSTHYMDEAERCHQIGYILQGRLLVHGAVDRVVEEAGIAAWRARGDGLMALAVQAKTVPEIETATILGGELRVAGSDIARIEAGLAALAPGRFERVEPSLEDVFIHTMNAEGAPS